MRSLTLIRERGATVPRLEAHFRRLGSKCRVLEAGCGRRWPLSLEGLSVEITGVDVDAAALRKRRDLNRALVADLRDRMLLPRHGFDVVYCSFVLEHVSGAEQVLDNFLDWVRPGGLLIVRVPDRDSAYGFLARMTPFRLHVLYKRWIEGMPNAGKPGFDPYPTHYDAIVSRAGMREFCALRGCRILDEYGTGFYLEGRWATLARVAGIALWALSFGRLAWRHNNLTFVIKAPATPMQMPEPVVQAPVTEEAVAF